VKEANKLWKKSARDESGLFLIEGYRELSRAIGSGIKIKTLFICEELFLGSHEGELIAQVDKGKRVHCIASLFKKLSYRDRPDGLLAIAHQKKMQLSELPHKEKELFIIAEAIEKPGNLGTILRTADGVGASAVLVVDRCTDIFNPNVVRASVGTCFTVPVVECTLDEALLFLKKREVTLIAATPHATKNYTEMDLAGSIAIALGTEQYGLSQAILEASDIQVCIPMRGVADSLNVAMAATILLYEALAQREKSRH
jgi:TrmH family RNA methyltransferase